MIYVKDKDELHTVSETSKGSNHAVIKRNATGRGYWFILKAVDMVGLDIRHSSPVLTRTGFSDIIFHVFPSLGSTSLFFDGPNERFP
jgi:hypothetical protein